MKACKQWPALPTSNWKVVAGGGGGWVVGGWLGGWGVVGWLGGGWVVEG